MPTQIRERICVDWHLTFIVEINNGIAERSYFSEKKVESIIFSDYSERVMRDLEKYFRGKSVDFDYVLVRYPTHFSEKILKIVRRVPYGKTVTYSDVALKSKTSPRAVGVALRMNLVPVIVPCHRVIAKNGMGGYSGGIEIKRMLLELEGVKV